jgi:hypothetical protein
VEQGPGADRPDPDPTPARGERTGRRGNRFERSGPHPRETRRRSLRTPHLREREPTSPKVTCLGRRPGRETGTRTTGGRKTPGATPPTTHPSNNDLLRQREERRSGTTATTSFGRKKLDVGAPRGPNVERRDGVSAIPSGRPGEGDEQQEGGNPGALRTNDRHPESEARSERSPRTHAAGESRDVKWTKTTGGQGLR